MTSLVRAALSGAALLGAALALLTAPARAEADPAQRPGYALIKNWDFGTNIRTIPELWREFHTRLVHDQGRLDYLVGNGEWQRYRDRTNHRIEDGVLKLIARETAGWRDGGFESGMIRSRLVQKYGYFEARVKMPRGRGLWPTVALQPEDSFWPPSITIVSLANNRPEADRTSYHVLHGRGIETTVKGKLDAWGGYSVGASYADDFHVFAVEWTPDSITHFVDGVPIATRRMPWLHDDEKDAGPAHLLVTLAVGGHWPGPPISRDDFPAVLEIDWIRVYARDPAPPIAAKP